MEYTGNFQGVKRDELIGGTLQPLEIFNVFVAQDAEIKRGDLLAAESFAGTFALATASDTAKVFVVAEKDFTASSESKVTQGYASGTFNREKIRTANNSLNTLEPALRRQNINLTTLKPFYTPEY